MTQRKAIDRLEERWKEALSQADAGLMITAGTMLHESRQRIAALRSQLAACPGLED